MVHFLAIACSIDLSYDYVCWNLGEDEKSLRVVVGIADRVLLRLLA